MLGSVWGTAIKALGATSLSGMLSSFVTVGIFRRVDLRVSGAGISSADVGGADTGIGADTTGTSKSIKSGMSELLCSGPAHISTSIRSGLDSTVGTLRDALTLEGACSRGAPRGTTNGTAPIALRAFLSRTLRTPEVSSIKVSNCPRREEPVAAESEHHSKEEGAS